MTGGWFVGEIIDSIARARVCFSLVSMIVHSDGGIIGNLLACLPSVSSPPPKVQEPVRPADVAGPAALAHRVRGLGVSIIELVSRWEIG